MDTAIEKIERAYRIAKLGYSGGVNVNLERMELEFLLTAAHELKISLESDKRVVRKDFRTDNVG
ncbi:MAG: hypothetical protein A2Z49_09625 [Chloroflexi bacterium RBG_19FT_COMBO_56_12]|nr:MAG: hypothetical protein A2Z49_09625 [Chloroflexi bacterium RBG_19FT_COMBO_56_12]